MTQIVATPKDMRAFGRDLRELCRSICQRQAQLEEELKGLRRTWNDDRYAQFSKTVIRASEELLVFHANAKLFADYLDRKAAAGERYLRGG